MIIIEKFVIWWLFIVIFVLIGILIRKTWFDNDSDVPAIVLSILFSFISTILLIALSSNMCNLITPDNIVEVIKFYEADLIVEDNLLKIQITRDNGTVEYGYIKLKNK